MLVWLAASDAHSEYEALVGCSDQKRRTQSNFSKKIRVYYCLIIIPMYILLHKYHLRIWLPGWKFSPASARVSSPYAQSASSSSASASVTSCALLSRRFSAHLRFFHTIIISAVKAAFWFFTWIVHSYSNPRNYVVLLTKLTLSSTTMSDHSREPVRSITSLDRAGGDQLVSVSHGQGC
jgi:hypothetical protein